MGEEKTDGSLLDPGEGVEADPVVAGGGDGAVGGGLSAASTGFSPLFEVVL